MQRKETPQSLSHRHCAVIGAVSLHRPSAPQLWPSAQSAVEAQVWWHCPPEQARPRPQAVSLVHNAMVAVPQLLPP